MQATAGAITSMITPPEGEMEEKKEKNKKKAGLNKMLIEKMYLLNNREER